jgi:hypothetical protein
LLTATITVGQSTLHAPFHEIFAPSPNDPMEYEVHLRLKDIVIEYPPIFGAELILSKTVPQLEPMPARINSRVFIKQNLTPVITFEFFENPTNVLPIGRFPDVPILAMTFDEHERI